MELRDAFLGFVLEKKDKVDEGWFLFSFEDFDFVWIDGDIFWWANAKRGFLTEVQFAAIVGWLKLQYGSN